MRHSYSLRKKSWHARVSLEIKNDTIDCLVRVDFNVLHGTDFRSELHYHRSYYSHGVYCTGHDTVFEVFVRLGTKKVDHLRSKLSYVLEPLGCHKTDILDWIDQEIKKALFVKPKIDVSSQRFLPPVKKELQMEPVLRAHL